jgi:hypothetical protein
MNAAPAVANANANANAVMLPVPAQAAASHPRVGQSVKRLRVAEQLETNHITEHELGQQFGCAVESALGMIPGPAQGLDAPAWAPPLLAMPAQMNTFNAQLITLRALQQNGLAEGPNDALVGVPNAAGQPISAVFPATRGQLCQEPKN